MGAAVIPVGTQKYIVFDLQGLTESLKTFQPIKGLDTPPPFERKKEQQGKCETIQSQIYGL